MWKSIRIFLLLSVLAAVALHTWLDRVATQSWQEPLWVGLFLFAARGMAGRNNIVITHELLHTVGASDKYDLGNGIPLFPSGYGDRDREPLYPQERAEIMAGRRALSAYQWDMPRTLAGVLIGPETAREIRWTR